MNLIVFPGGGNPEEPNLYQKVYALITKKAPHYGYNSINILKYPGHSFDDTNLDRLTLDGAIDNANLVVQEFDRNNLQYDFLGRSFGAIVASKYAIDKKPKGLRKIILWGPPPYSLIWEMFVRDITDTIKTSKTKGLLADKTFFPSVVPIESILGKLEYPTIIATGTKDPYSTYHYVNYLKSFFEHKLNFTFKIVEYAFHEITEENCKDEVINTYFEALFR